MKINKFLLSAILTLSSVAFVSATIKYNDKKANYVNNNFIHLSNPINANVIRNVTKGTEYETVSAAISAASSGDSLELLSSVTQSSFTSITITSKNLSLDGKGYVLPKTRLTISGGSIFNLSNITLDGGCTTSLLDNGRLIYVTDASTVLNLNEGVIIQNHYTTDLDSIRAFSATINIADSVNINHCGGGSGVIYIEGAGHININGGEIHDCGSMSGGSYHEATVLYASNGSEINITGGSIYDNVDIGNPYSKGIVFINNYGTGAGVNFTMTGGTITNNKSGSGSASDTGVTLGGAIYCASSSSVGVHNITIGGDAKIFNNTAYDKIKHEYIPSDVYLQNNGMSDQYIYASNTVPLTEDAKIGVFTPKLPTTGDITIVQNAAHDNAQNFFSNNSDYKTLFNENTSTIDLHKYGEREPRYTDPVPYSLIKYTGNEEKLIKTPGIVEEGYGGDMKYSLDYKGDISTATWVTDYNKVTAKKTGTHNIYYYVESDGAHDASPVYYVTSAIYKEKEPMIINWPEDAFVANDQVQKLTPTYINSEGEVCELNTIITVNGITKEFKDPTVNENTKYLVTAIDPGDPDFIFPEDCSRYYTMRIRADKVEKEIENLPDSDKPIVKVESEVGFDAWTKLVAKSVDKEEEKEEYQETTQDLTKSNNLSTTDNVSAVYDVKILNQDNISVQPDGTLKIHFALPKGITTNQNINIYHIHDNGDGTKEVTKLSHEFTEDGYASIITDTLSSFVIVHHRTSLLWLIITLGMVNVALVTTIIFTITKKKNKKVAKGGKK